MMDDGSRHDPDRAPESEPAPEAVDQPGWFGRVWARVRRAWRWVRRKHEPISEGDRDRRARLDALREDGGVDQPKPCPDGDGDREKNSAILAKGRGRARRIGRSLVGFGAGLHRFGVRLNNTGRKWAPLGEDIGEHLGELDIAPLPAPKPARAASARGESSFARPQPLPTRVRSCRPRCRRQSPAPANGRAANGFAL